MDYGKRVKIHIALFPPFLSVFRSMLVEDVRTYEQTSTFLLQRELDPTVTWRQTCDLTVLTFEYRGYAFVLKKAESGFEGYHMVLSRYGYDEEREITRRDLSLVCGEESCFDATNCSEFTPISRRFTAQAAVVGGDNTLIVALTRALHYNNHLHSVCAFNMGGLSDVLDGRAECPASKQV